MAKKEIKVSYTAVIYILCPLLVFMILGFIFLGIRNTNQYSENFEDTDDSIIKNSDAYIIAMNDTLFEKAADNLKETLKPLEIKKFDAIKGAELGSLLEDKETLTFGALYDITVPNYRRTHAELGTKNAIGCYMSHTALWKQLLESDKEGYYIFESDAICTKNADIFNVTRKFLEKPDGHILFFGDFNAIKTKEITKVENRFYGMHAYYITRKGAELCLKYAFPIEQQIDSYLSDLLLLSQNTNVNFPSVNFYISNLCAQYNKEGSSIQLKRVLCTA
jgi:GR25 family glycosyltransferase involved in LPS biosynthesis